MSYISNAVKIKQSCLKFQVLAIHPSASRHGGHLDCCVVRALSPYREGNNSLLVLNKASPDRAQIVDLKVNARSSSVLT